VKEADFRLECGRCGRPQVGCYCSAVTPVETRTRVLLLQHPREHGKAVNTARIAALALPAATLHVGVDFSRLDAVSAVLDDPSRPAILLYPGPGVRDLAEDPPVGPVTLVVIDGTWHQARALIRKNPRIAALPRYAFQPPAPSQYRIRKEPTPECVSTIEALAYALPLLEGDAARFLALLEPFRAMVDFQVEHAGRSLGGRKRDKRRNNVAALARLPDELLARQLVCVTGEANAWPVDRSVGLPPHPHELVHWLAGRLDDASCFESILKPRCPLASSPMCHSRIDERALAQGASVPDLLQAFSTFTREGDVICTWGHYGRDLYLREQPTALAHWVDIRKVVGDYLKRRPGSIESIVEERGLAYTPQGSGRGGERLGMLMAVTRWLASEAHAQMAAFTTRQLEAQP
jgi:DTW domain-containing protein YfiP